MIKEAATAGLYDSEAHGRKFPRVQILTVNGLLEGNERPEYVNVDADLGFKRAKRETTAHRGNVEMELDNKGLWIGMAWRFSTDLNKFDHDWRRYR